MSIIGEASQESRHNTDCMHQAFRLVRDHFRDLKQTYKWIHTRTPVLGGISLIDMFIIGRGDKAVELISKALKDGTIEYGNEKY